MPTIALLTPLLAACLAACAAPLAAQDGAAEEAAAERALYQVRVDHQHGFIDAAGEFVVPPRLDGARAFHEGRAAFETGVVRTGNRFDHTESTWGFLDETGAVVIEPLYDSVGDFSEGLASVRIDGRHGYVDRDGELVIPAIWSGRVGEFVDGRAYVELGRERLGYIDRAGDLVFTLSDIEFGDPGTFSEGLVRVLTSDDGVRYVDVDGEVAFALDDAFGRAFAEGLAAVRVGGGWGHVDASGAFVLEPTYDRVGSFSEGLAIVRSDGRSFFVDREGRAPFSCEAFDRLGSFSEGLARVRVAETGKFGYVDRSGALVIPATWDDAETSASLFRGGVACVGRRVPNDRGGTRLVRLFIDRAGEVVFDPENAGDP